MAIGTGALRGRDVETFAEISLTGSTGRALSVVEINAANIRFTGTLGSSITLTLPLSPTSDRGRTYSFENACAGGFTITLSPVAGGVGVDLAANGAVTCLYDGTDLIARGGGATSIPVSVGGTSTLYPLVLTDPVIGDAITYSGDGTFVNTPAGAATMAIGSAVATGTAGSVLFIGAGGLLAQDNANLFWADATNRLGIGTNTPDGPLDVENDSASILARFKGAGLFSSVFMQLGDNTQQAALRVYPGVDASGGEPLVEMGGIILRGHYWSGAASVGADGWWRIEMEDTTPTFYLVAGTGSPAVEHLWIRQDGQITLGNAIPTDNPAITQPVVLGGLTFVTTDITFNALADLIFDTSTGSKFGTSATQKMGWWGADPVVQASSPTGTDTQKIDGLIAIMETYGLLGA